MSAKVWTLVDGSFIVYSIEELSEFAEETRLEDEAAYEPDQEDLDAIDDTD